MRLGLKKYVRSRGRTAARADHRAGSGASLYHTGADRRAIGLQRLGTDAVEPPR